METFVAGLCFAKDVLFKSYYVVWKRLEFNFKHIVFLSLNRTM